TSLTPPALHSFPTRRSSDLTDVISSNAAPRNMARPTVSGTPQIGEELTAAHGTWTGGVRSYAYQWQRCDATGEGCADAVGANGRSEEHTSELQSRFDLVCRL